MYPCRFLSPIRFFVMKVITKMASHENCEGSVKSPATDKIDATENESQSKDDEKKSSVNQHDEPNNDITDTEEKKNLTLDTSNDANVQEKDADNVKSESKHDPNSLVTVKKQLDDSEQDKKQEAQNVAKKQETSNADFQKTIEEKDIKTEDDKESVAKIGSVLKRKRKSLRLV